MDEVSQDLRLMMVHVVDAVTAPHILLASFRMKQSIASIIPVVVEKISSEHIFRPRSRHFRNHGMVQDNDS
jgi:hypothetical protein